MYVAEIAQKELIASAIVAKATFKRENGFDIIVVHEKSTQNEFYWQYTARTKRSPRRSWKFTKSYARDLSPQYWQNFEGFVTHYAETNAAKMVVCRIQNPRRLAVLSTLTTLTPSINPNVTMQIMWSMKDKARGIYKTKPASRILRDADGHLTDIQPVDVPEGEVWVFRDYCPHCETTHWCAHFPGRKIFCSDLTQTLQNPALRYGFHNGGVFYLFFRTLPPAQKPTQISTRSIDPVSFDLSAQKASFLSRE